MPHSVISGFMSGIGIILILIQMPSMLGFDTPSGGVVGVMQSLPQMFANIQWYELAIGGSTLLILLFYPKRFKKYVPPQLVALIGITLVATFSVE